LQHRVGIIGATGRLGQEICDLAIEMECRVTLLASSKEWTNECTPQTVIDVSHRSGLMETVRYCRDERVPLVVGVSNLSPEHHEELRKLSQTVPVVYAANLAFGHFLQRCALRGLADVLRRVPQTWECSILERHPTSKLDRPSATARELASAWATATGQTVADVASARGGLPVSDHEITLTLNGEMVTIKHSVTDRRAAARGALVAARWITNQQPGFYTMSDVYAFREENIE
jgi:4-hydroxy-tetrahydrodipicolinate reductase